MKTYRVGIMGCRSRGTAVGRAYGAHPRTEVVGLCDRHPERMAALGKALGVQAHFADPDEMIREEEPDIVAVTTGTASHYELAMRVLEHGVHVDVEKPMCADLVQADALVAKACEKGARIAVHHQGRVGAHFRAVVRAVCEGRLGTVRHILSCGKSYYGGYGLLHIGTHLLNAMLAFTGPCLRVVASALTAGRPTGPVDVLQGPMGTGTICGEQITSILEFESGITCTHFEHRQSPQAYGMELIGSEGRIYTSIRLSRPGAWSTSIPHVTPDVSADCWQALPPAGPSPDLSGQRVAADDYGYVDEYVHALDEGRDHPCSGTGGVHVLEIVMAIFESAAYGGPVDLPQAERAHPLVRWRREAGLEPAQEMPMPYVEWLAAEDIRLGRQ